MLSVFEVCWLNAVKRKYKKVKCYISPCVDKVHRIVSIRSRFMPSFSNLVT